MKKWDSFTKRILIEKPADDVYRCWATKGTLKHGFSKKRIMFRGKFTEKPMNLFKRVIISSGNGTTGTSQRKAGFWKQMEEISFYLRLVQVESSL